MIAGIDKPSRPRGGTRSPTPRIPSGKVRFAVVGLGNIAQVAVLPAFSQVQHAELAALVTGDPDKARKLGKKYKVPHVVSYDQYDDLLESGDVDAVYIALPNDMHKDATIRAARAGVHVLCEKPMAVTEGDCRAMIRACEQAGVMLMIAYRLHFEPATLAMVETVRSGKLGEVKLFSSVFTMDVPDPENIRLQSERGGGPVEDIGTYCINAARMVFGEEPTDVVAFARAGDPDRFREVPESVCAMLRYPSGGLATFCVSFDASGVSQYQVVGTKGDLRLDPAYEYAEGLKHHLTINDKTREKAFAHKDQFAGEIAYFCRCLRSGEKPEPSGEEGLADVAIIRAIMKSAQTGRPVRLHAPESGADPVIHPRNRIDKLGRSKPQTVNAPGPHQTQDNEETSDEE